LILITHIEGDAPATLAKLEQILSQKNLGDMLKLRVISNDEVRERTILIESDKRWMDAEDLEKHYRMALTNLNSLGKRK
jgi:hypothetical protein